MSTVHTFRDDEVAVVAGSRSGHSLIDSWNLKAKSTLMSKPVFKSAVNVRHIRGSVGASRVSHLS